MLPRVRHDELIYLCGKKFLSIAFICLSFILGVKYYFSLNIYFIEHFHYYYYYYVYVHESRDELKDKFLEIIFKVLSFLIRNKNRIKFIIYLVISAVRFHCKNCLFEFH